MQMVEYGMLFSTIFHLTQYHRDVKADWGFTTNTHHLLFIIVIFFF